MWCFAISFGVCFLLVLFDKYILAAITVLMGDKEGLQEFGNLCDDPKVPWTDKFYSGDDLPPELRLKKREPKPPWKADGPPEKFKWPD